MIGELRGPREVLRYRPELEYLEDRACPSTLTWNAQTGVIKYEAAAGEINDLDILPLVQIGQAFIQFKESGTNVAGGGNITITCANPFQGGNAPGVAALFPLAQANPQTIEIHLGDQDDTLIISYSIFTLAFGSGGNDTMSFIGAAGAVAFGGSGNDSFSGSELSDTFHGEAGIDVLVGAGGSDTLNGGDDNDGLYGEAGPDLLYGNSGEDLLRGGDGDDLLDGGNDTSQDVLEGGADADVFYTYFLQDLVVDFSTFQGDRIAN